MTAEELLGEHIARGLAAIDAILADRGGATHASAVERAAKLSDHVLADFLRRESAPDYIAGEIASIRRYAALGALQVAYEEYERLRLRLDFLSQTVRAPTISTGFKQRQALATRRNAGNEKKQIDGEERHAAWQDEANEIWRRNSGLSATAVASVVKAKLGCDAKVDTIRRTLKKPT